MTLRKSSHPQQGEIWLVDYTYKFQNIENSGFEIESQIKKLRPSLILSNDLQNEFNNRIIVAPLTSKGCEDINSPFEVLIEKDKNNHLEKNSKVLLNFLLSVDKNYRFEKYLGKINDKLTTKIEKGIAAIFSS